MSDRPKWISPPSMQCEVTRPDAPRPLADEANSFASFRQHSGCFMTRRYQRRMTRQPEPPAAIPTRLHACTFSINDGNRRDSIWPRVSPGIEGAAVRIAVPCHPWKTGSTGTPARTAPGRGARGLGKKPKLRPSSIRNRPGTKRTRARAKSIRTRLATSHRFGESEELPGIHVHRLRASS
jgi:hypothetical protein